MTVSYLQNSALTVPLLVVPMTDYNREVPVIVGTNIIRLNKITCDGSDAVPAEWTTAFSPICSDRFGVVKTTKKLTLKPNESRTVTGLVRKNRNAESALTSPIEGDGLSSKLTICPRVVRADKPGTPRECQCGCVTCLQRLWIFFLIRVFVALRRLKF